MKSDLKYKLLVHLNDKQAEKGFTLIELLVVVIIIGVLAAVALPNLLKQVGKSRETEIKNAAGTVNRSQQSYHFERQAFAPALSFLGISVPNEYISNASTLGIVGGTSSGATVQPENSNYVNDGTRAYSGRIEYVDGNYSQVLCQSDAVTDVAPVPLAGASECDAGTIKVR